MVLLSEEECLSFTHYKDSDCFAMALMGSHSMVGNEEFNQHLASSTGAGSVFDQNLCNISVRII